MQHRVIGRLKPGVSLDQVNAEFVGSGQAISEGLSENEPNNLTSASVQPLLNAFIGPQLRQIFGRCSAPSFSCC